MNIISLVPEQQASVDKLTKERDQLKAEVERLKGNRSNLINELVTIVEKYDASIRLNDEVYVVMSEQPHLVLKQ